MATLIDACVRPRAKTWEREVPADGGLIRLYSDYRHQEYGPVDCDYVS